MVDPVVREHNSAKHVWTRARKVLCIFKAPVPQSDAGRRGENPKTNGRTLVKELGKMTP